MQTKRELVETTHRGCEATDPVPHAAVSHVTAGMDQGAHREGAGSHHGGLEIAISWTVQPKLQMSDFRPYPSPRITSGAIQYGVPRT